MRYTTFTVLYTENYKTFMKKIEEDPNKWKDILCSWIGRINIVEISILSKGIYTLNTIPVRIPMTFFIEIERKFLKFKWNHTHTKTLMLK